ncbi:MAG: hypothetical protein V4736_06895 [Bdellovibrionota bacterium]
MNATLLFSTLLVMTVGLSSALGSEFVAAVNTSGLVHGETRIQVKYPIAPQTYDSSSYKNIDSRPSEPQGVQVYIAKAAFLINKPVTFFQDPNLFQTASLRKLFPTTQITPVPGQPNVNNVVVNKTGVMATLGPLIGIPTPTFRGKWAGINVTPQVAAAFAAFDPQTAAPQAVSYQWGDNFNFLFNRSVVITRLYRVNDNQTLAISDQIIDVRTAQIPKIPLFNLTKTVKSLILEQIANFRSAAEAM